MNKIIYGEAALASAGLIAGLAACGGSSHPAPSAPAKISNGQASTAGYKYGYDNYAWPPSSTEQLGTAAWCKQAATAQGVPSYVVPNWIYGCEAGVEDTSQNQSETGQ